jgi:hypothetical protein
MDQIPTQPAPVAARPRPSAALIASWVLAAVLLLLVVPLKLLPALLSGLLVYQLVHTLAPGARAQAAERARAPDRGGAPGDGDRRASSRS